MKMDRYRTVQITYTSGQERILLVTEKERELIYRCAANGKPSVTLEPMGVISLQHFRMVQDLDVAADRARAEQYWLDQAKKHGAETQSLDAEKLVQEATGKK